MAKATRVEVLDIAGHIVGFFFAIPPLEECRKCQVPLDFRKVLGEWVPAGGISYDAQGANAWFHNRVFLGEMVEVDS